MPRKRDKSAPKDLESSSNPSDESSGQDPSAISLEEASTASAGSTDTTPSDLNPEPLILTDGMLIAHIARAFQIHYYLAKDSQDNLFVSQNGHFIPACEMWVGEKMVEWLSGPGRPGEARMSSRVSHEVYLRLHYNKPKLLDIPPYDIINVKNGRLKFNQSTSSWFLQPSSTSYLSTVQIPINYDPAAKCPRWDEMCQLLLDPGIIPLVEEVYGACMSSHPITQEAIWLYGEGNNGKSVFIDALKGVIGEENTSEISFSELATDRFIGSEVYGKLLVYDYDSAPGKVDNASLFKKITSGDTIRAQAKYGHPFNFRPFAKMVFAGNFEPEAKDASSGFLRRFIIIPFNRNFGDPDLAAMRRPRVEVAAGMSTEEEKSGILNRALAGFTRLLTQKKFSQPNTVSEATSRFKAAVHPVREFLRSEFVIRDTGKDGYVKKSSMAQGCSKWQKWMGMKPMTEAAIVDYISKNEKELKAQEKRLDDGTRARVYFGVRLNHEALNELN